MLKAKLLTYTEDVHLEPCIIGDVHEFLCVPLHIPFLCARGWLVPPTFVMAARGVSVTELAQGTLQAKRVYDAFHAGFNNSSLRIRELGDIIRYLHDILDKIHKVVERLGTVFPGGPSFRRRLEACGDFIDRHSELRPVESIRTGTKSSLSQRTRRIWQTGGQSFDSDAEKLKRALILELQRLNIFILVCAL